MCGAITVAKHECDWIWITKLLSRLLYRLIDFNVSYFRFSSRFSDRGNTVDSEQTIHSLTVYKPRVCVGITSSNQRHTCPMFLLVVQICAHGNHFHPFLKQDEITSVLVTDANCFKIVDLKLKHSRYCFGS